MNHGQDKRIAVLASAALEKKRLAFEATEKAIRNLTTSNQKITVANVARIAGVSTSYIYKYPEFKSRIDSLKNQQNFPLTTQKTSSDNSKTAIINTLRTEIKNLNSKLIESQRANQLLIGKLYQHQDTEDIYLNLRNENKNKSEIIKQLQSELTIMKQELLTFQEKWLQSQIKLPRQKKKVTIK
jgi:Fe-S cluster assembly scaffold protein SufB